MACPLAEQLRPHTLADFVGQEKAVGNQGLIRSLLHRAQDSSFFPSLIFWGPPGCGKTTLARIIAKSLQREYYEFSAVHASVKDIEKILPVSQNGLPFTPPLLFLDEIHRFNKAQQDTLLPHVERGTITLLGATTENPSFSVIHALLSRCRVVTLHQLTPEDLTPLLQKASVHLGQKIDSPAEEFLIRAAQGDARTLLNVIEIASHLAEGKTITLVHCETALQRRSLGFDKGGEEFYNTISALHKSVRGSDPNASLYWLARMLEAGQDPLYIARRLIRMASEDIGLASPNALLIANAAYEACKNIGMPEASLALAQATAYLAKAPKSNALYTGFAAAQHDATEYGALPVPLHIRNAPTSLMKSEGYGKEYDYSHSSTGVKKEGICYFPDSLGEKNYLNLD
jgi:putative ATPase